MVNPTNVRNRIAISGILVAWFSINCGIEGRTVEAQTSWKISHGPLLTATMDPSPITVVGVTGDLGVGGIAAVQIRQNRGPAPLTITLGWYLRTLSGNEKVIEDGKIIHHGESTGIDVQGLQIGAMQTLEHLVVAYAEVRRILAANGASPGPVYVHVAVDEINFADGSRWARSSTGG